MFGLRTPGIEARNTKLFLEDFFATNTENVAAECACTATTFEDAAALNASACAINSAEVALLAFCSCSVALTGKH